MQIAVRVANQFACFSDFSDTLEIEVLDLPSKPVITQNLDTLEIIEVDSIQWYLNGDTISGATANKLEIDKSGSYYVEVFNKNRCKNVSDEMYYVYSESNLITKAEDKFKIIPNPFTDRINIIYSGNRTDLISWEIIQLDGKVVKLKNLWQKDNISMQIPTSDIPSGIYFLIIQSTNLVITQKLVKQ